MEARCGEGQRGGVAGELLDVRDRVWVFVKPFLDGPRLLALAVLVDNEIFEAAIVIVVKL